MKSRIEARPAPPAEEPRAGLPVQSLAYAGAEHAVTRMTIQASAREGIGSSSSSLPFRAPIARAFGKHDVSSIQAHIGARATASATAMNARAFASGNHVVFAGKPDLRTAAHEAAHVVQQRAGVQLAGGVGTVGDQYERHADAVADRVVAGGSAESLLDAFTDRGSGASVQRTVQRKVGFELELMVPSLSTPQAIDAHFVGAEPHDNVKRFLLGGVPYATDLGQNANFKLTADHNKRISRKPIVAALHAEGKMANIDYKDISSNLEYVTPAIDELAPGSNATLTALFGALRAHIATTVGRARGNVVTTVTAPANPTTYTGIPTNRFQTWLTAEQYGRVSPSIEAFRGAVADRLYLQATVGILPSSIPELFRQTITQAQPDHDDFDDTYPTTSANAQALHAFTVTDSEVTRLLAYPAFRDHAYVVELRDHGTSYEAMQGVLYLLFSYAIGNALYQTSGKSSGTVKNAVPYLMKMYAEKTLKLAGTAWLRANPAPKSLATIVTTFIKASRYTTVDYWVNTRGLQRKAKPAEKRLIKEDIDDLVTEMIRGKDASARIVYGQQDLPNPDAATDDRTALPEGYKHEVYGQQGVPVEYRKINARPSSAGVTAELQKVVAQARALNTRPLTAEQRTALFATF